MIKPYNRKINYLPACELVHLDILMPPMFKVMKKTFRKVILVI